MKKFHKCCVKLNTPKEREEVQLKLFKMGYRWAGGETTPQYLNMHGFNFIVIKDGRLTKSSTHHDYKQIPIEEILGKQTKYPNGTRVVTNSGKIITIKCQYGDQEYIDLMEKHGGQHDMEGFLDTTSYLDGRGFWRDWSSIKRVDNPTPQRTTVSFSEEDFNQQFQKIVGESFKGTVFSNESCVNLKKRKKKKCLNFSPIPPSV